MKLIGPLIHSGQLMRALRKKTSPEPVRAPEKPSEASVLPEDHSCLRRPLPRAVWGSLPLLPLQQCPACVHPLGMHSLKAACIGCVQAKRIADLERDFAILVGMFNTLKNGPQ